MGGPARVAPWIPLQTPTITEPVPLPSPGVTAALVHIELLTTVPETDVALAAKGRNRIAAPSTKGTTFLLRSMFMKVF
jgi:hypothetical protein